jgi:hypothetical protein
MQKNETVAIILIPLHFASFPGMKLKEAIPEKEIAPLIRHLTVEITQFPQR